MKKREPNGKILRIQNLRASIGAKEILKGLDLVVKPGEIHALMGPNGSGKSTLANAVFGHPALSVSQGSVFFGSRNLLSLSPDARSRLGLFLSFQHPLEVQGLSLNRFLFHAFKSRFPKEKISPLEFQKKLLTALRELRLPSSFAQRDLNVGFSGGEKKRAEILQLRLLKPFLAVLDETDSGLDIDSLKLVADSLNKMRSPGFSALVITHYPRILRHLKPDFVHVLLGGKIVASGKMKLAEELEEKGFQPFLLPNSSKLEGAHFAKGKIGKQKSLGKTDR